MLQKQLLPIQIGGGIDTKTDPKKVISSKLLTLENGIFTTPGKIIKRDGYTNLGNAIITGGNNVVGQAVLSYDDQLNKIADNTFFSYIPDGSASVSKGPAYSVAISNTPVVQGGQIATGYSDMAQVGSYQVYIYVNNTDPFGSGTGPASVTVVDSTTGAFLVDQVVLNSHGTSSVGPSRCVTVGTRVVMIMEEFFFGSPGYYGFYFDSTNPTHSIDSTGVFLFTGVTNPNATGGSRPDPNLYFDATALGSNVVMAHVNNGTIVTSLISSSLAVGTTTTITLPSQLFVDQVAIAVDPVTSNVWVACIYEDASTGNSEVGFFVLNSSLAIVEAFQPNIFPGLDTLMNLTMAKTDASTMTIVVETAVNLDYTLDDPTLHYCTFGTINTTTFVVTPPVYTPSGDPTGLVSVGGIASKIFQINGSNYMASAFQSSVQPCYFLVTLSGFTVAQILPNQAFGLPPWRIVPQVTLASTTEAQIPFAITKAIVQTEGGTLITGAITLETIDFSDDTSNFQNSQLDPNIFISGGVSSIYDGANFYENQFLLFPEQPLAVTSGSGVLTGTYEYIAIFELIDRNGQVRQSATSIPVSIVTSSNEVTITVNVVIQSNYGFLSNSTNFNEVIGVSLFRTDSDGTVFHRLSNVGGFQQSYLGSGVRTLTFTDNTADADIDDNELLYTTGGVLDNDVAPASTSSTVFDNRLFLFGLENNTQIAFSKQYQSGVPVSFSDEFTMQIPLRGGPVFAGAAMDSNLIIFKQSSIFVVNGTGPDNTGAGSAYSIPQILVSPVGCSYPKSIAFVPQNPDGPGGLIFKSDKGFWLLDRSLQSEYIGADVDAYNSHNVISAQVLENQNQVRFLLDSGNCLVYDYFVNQWSVFTNFTGVGATLYQNQYTYLGPTGIFYQETPGYYLDDTTPISLKIGTAWIKLSDIQNFQRIRRLYVVGDYFSPHFLNGQIYFDYETTPSETFQFTPQNVLGLNGDDNVYQFRYHMARQKCEAVQFVIFDDFTGLTAGEGYSLSEFSIEAGLKQGGNKLSPYKTVG
jgi:hypothetical protein